MIPLTGAFEAPPQKPQRVFTTDLDHFWTAYDSIRTTKDSLKQVRFFNRIYLSKGSPGLKAFQEVKGNSVGLWVSSIRRYPRFWNSIRPRTQLTKAAAQEIEASLAKLKTLYPALRPSKVYFTMGNMRSSGITKDSLVVIGAEMATGSPQTDVTRLPKNTAAFLSRYYKKGWSDDLVPVNVHEYVHTQLSGYGKSVLGQALNEGTCDFVTELVTGKAVPFPYLPYGKLHEAALKERFKLEMFIPVYLNWSADQAPDDFTHVADLNYYMGYAICKAYYAQALNKTQAVRDMLTLDYTNDRAVQEFLEKSKYYPEEPIRQLREAFNQKQPDPTRVRPFVAENGTIDATTTQLTVDFPQPVSPYASVRRGPRGEATWPTVGALRFSGDNKSVIVPVQLQPAHDYEFIVAEGGSRSLEDYPLKSYLLKFSTK
ncbi:hypothetical protein [Hymenobacter sp.]|uniref:hypothetical protein n=1 Tax=Hymenobacter sp. TaxID=1898978 RepID=UPI002EDAFBAE